MANAPAGRPENSEKHGERSVNHSFGNARS